MWLHELDANGYEIRMVVTFLDGHSERAGHGEETEYAFFGPEPLPSINEINAQEEFEAVEITEDEFNQAWDSARPTATG
jgi:hypothetical protein